MEKTQFEKNIVILGHGSIARAVIPLIHEHFIISPTQVKVLAKSDSLKEKAGLPDTSFIDVTLTKDNFSDVLNEHVSSGDLIVNLTAGVGCIDLILYCSEHDVLYLDTCTEMWPDEVTPDSKTYDERQLLLKAVAEFPEGSTTALSSMGANPGIVSLLTKRLMLLIAEDVGIETANPIKQRDWAELARQLTVHAIHVNERDTQYSSEKVEDNTFFSTWSVEAMIVESIESAEMAIGSHETLPSRAHYCEDGNGRDIYFDTSGKDTRIKTWLPLAGEIKAMILNHNEPYSIAELYAIDENDIQYSPTVCFAYHPCDQTMESLKHLNEDNYESFIPRLLLDDIVDGRDELGVFVITEKYGSFWLGSRLDIHTARTLNDKSSATSLQVAAGVIAGMCWVVNNRKEGFVEPENIDDHDYVLNVAEKYWGGYVFKKTNWIPSVSDLDSTTKLDSYLEAP